MRACAWNVGLVPLFSSGAGIDCPLVLRAILERIYLMISKLRTMALAAALVTGASGMALAQGCPPGYYYDGAYCRPGAGGVVGGAANAAGAIVGGAANTAGAIVGGTVGAVTGAPYYAPAPAPAYGPTCPAGYYLAQGTCYPRQ
jgi:hypothetical protein